MERRGEEWNRKERNGEVRYLDKLWFKGKKKKRKLKRREIGEDKSEEKEEEGSKGGNLRSLRTKSTTVHWKLNQT